MIIVNGIFQHQVVHLILPFQLTRLRPVFTSVTVTGNGFDPISTVAITFGGSTCIYSDTYLQWRIHCYLQCTFTSSIGDQTVKATQGFNSASKTFKVTALVNPIIFLDPASGPVGTSVNITGAGFDPGSTVTITFDGADITTSPCPSDNYRQWIIHCYFTCTFIIERSLYRLVATQGSKSASKTFTVTSGSYKFN